MLERYIFPVILEVKPFIPVSLSSQFIGWFHELMLVCLWSLCSLDCPRTHCIESHLPLSVSLGLKAHPTTPSYKLIFDNLRHMMTTMACCSAQHIEVLSLPPGISLKPSEERNSGHWGTCQFSGSQPSKCWGPLIYFMLFSETSCCFELWSHLNVDRGKFRFQTSLRGNWQVSGPKWSLDYRFQILTQIHHRPRVYLNILLGGPIKNQLTNGELAGLRAWN